LDEYQKQRAIVALRRLDSEKSIKKYKLDEHFANVRLALLLHLPYAVIKIHHNCRMSVCNETGLVRFQFPDGYIPIREYLKRNDSPTFESWLQEFHPEEFEKYKRDKIKFLFGDCKDLKRTDAAQSLYDEFDRYTWFKNEQERRFYFSGLLADCDIAALDEFALFGSVGGHSAEEMQSFKAELLSMQKEYEQNPDRFFHPSVDLIAAHASGSDTVSGERASPTDAGEGVSYKDMEKMRKNKQI
jgi:hypothetical protein